MMEKQRVNVTYYTFVKTTPAQTLNHSDMVKVSLHQPVPRARHPPQYLPTELKQNVAVVKELSGTLTLL